MSMIAIAVNRYNAASAIGGHTTEKVDLSACSSNHAIAKSATCVSASTARREGFNDISGSSELSHLFRLPHDNSLVSLRLQRVRMATVSICVVWGKRSRR